MAIPGGRDTERTHEQLLGSMKQDEISEEEADELREKGQGFERPSSREAGGDQARQAAPRQDTGDEVERLASGQSPSVDERSYRTPSRTHHAEEEAPAKRAGFSEGERTQLEEDFGERGLRTRGTERDSEHKPSILEPTDEDY